METGTEYSLGCLPSIPDFRNYRYAAIMPKELDIPSVVDLRPGCSPVKNQLSVGACHDDKTEVMTVEGWKFFKDITKEDLLASVNPETQELIFENPSDIISYDYDGELVCLKHASADFAVTPNHRMLVRKLVDSDRSLSDKYEFVEAKDLGWYSGLMNKVEYKGYSDSDTYEFEPIFHQHKDKRNGRSYPMNYWLRFLGIYVAEGTLCSAGKNNNYRIQLAACKDREKEFIRDTLDNISVCYNESVDRFFFHDKQIYVELAKYGFEGIHTPEKSVPKFIFQLSAENISEFLLGFFMGDGCMNGDSRSYYTSSEKLANDLQILITLSGKWCGLYSRTSVIGGRIIRSTGDYDYSLNEWKGKGLSIDKKDYITNEYYKGKVYCAEVPTYHTLVTRRNGKVLISGNCTAFAMTGLMEFLDMKDDGRFTSLSELFVYYLERDKMGTVDWDSGSYINYGLDVLAKRGSCTEDEMPYINPEYRYKIMPTGRQLLSGLRRRISTYWEIYTLDEMFTCLADGYPFVGGVSVYDSFVSDEIRKTGVIPMPRESESRRGAHAIVLVGYSMMDQRFIFRNSWGVDFGHSGYGTIPFQYIEDMGFDYWTVRK
jgi:hypothetical protein